MPIVPTVSAEVTFLSPEEGGRRSVPGLASAWYRPHLVVQSPDVRMPVVVEGNRLVEDYLGVRFVDGPAEEVPPNSTATCTLELTYHPRVCYDALAPGATFTIREGGRIVGFGRVLERSDVV